MKMTTKPALVALLLALGAPVAAGCGSKKEDPGPPCAKVMEHVHEVARKAFPGHGDMAMGNIKVDVERCEARKLPASVRRCMVSAQTMEELSKCQPREKKAPPTSPAPAGAGGPATAPAGGAPAGSAAAPAGSASVPAAPAPAAPAPAP
jgi:hypothetical protein